MACRAQLTEAAAGPGQVPGGVFGLDVWPRTPDLHASPAVTGPLMPGTVADLWVRQEGDHEVVIQADR